MALRWCADDFHDEYIADDEEASKTGLLPVTAWRRLGQLRAIEAIDPLIGMMNPLNNENDEWFLLDFPHVFVLIGAASIQSLVGFFVNDSNGEFARTFAAECMGTIAQNDSSCRDQVVEILESE